MFFCSGFRKVLCTRAKDAGEEYELARALLDLVSRAVPVGECGLHVCACACGCGCVVGMWSCGPVAHGHFLFASDGLQLFSCLKPSAGSER